MKMHVCYPKGISLTVRLLEPSTGTTSTIFLRLATTRVSNQKIPVVRQQSSAQFLDDHKDQIYLFVSCKCPQYLFPSTHVLGALVNVLGVVSNDALGDGRPDGVHLGRHTSSFHSDANVKVGELVLSEDEDRLEGLESEAFGLDELDRLTIDLDQAASLLGEGASGGGLLPVVFKLGVRNCPSSNW